MSNCVKFINSINIDSIINIAIVIFLLSSVIALRFKNRIKTYAVMIPFWTTVSVVLYHMYVKTSFQKTYQKIACMLADAGDNTLADKEFINKAVESIEKLMNDSFKSSIDFLIGLLGIVISVWVGLTIYNAIKKDELDNLIENVEKANEINAKAHASKLYKTFDTNWTSSEYYLKEFSKINWKLEDADIISDILLIENCFQRIVAYYNKNDYINIQRFSLHALELCEEAVDKTRNHKVMPTVEGYFLQRKADFLYYRGMGEKYTGTNAQQTFEDAIKWYNMAINKDKKINCYGYLDNTIGYLLYLLFGYDSKNYHLKQAEKYLIMACREDKYIYHKNLGCVYEAMGEFDDAEKYYRQAIVLNPNDYKSRICLASLLIKRLQTDMGINPKRTEVLFKMTFSYKEKYESLIEETERILNVAEKISPSTIDTYYKRGQLLTYCYLLRKDETIVTRIKENFDMANALNTTFTANKFHERNYYEAIGKIKKAMEINDSLLFDGDSEHMSKLYLKELGGA